MGRDGWSGQGSGRSTNRLGSLVVFFTNDENFEFFFFPAYCQSKWSRMVGLWLKVSLAHLIYFKNYDYSWFSVPCLSCRREGTRVHSPSKHKSSNLDTF